MKTPRNRKGKDRLAELMPVPVARVGMKVWWQHTFHHQGNRHARWRMGIIEVKRGGMAIIRNGYGHEHVVGVGMLFFSGST